MKSAEEDSDSGLLQPTRPTQGYLRGLGSWSQIFGNPGFPMVNLCQFNGLTHIWDLLYGVFQMNGG